MGENMLASIEQEIKNAGRLKLIDNYKYNQLFDSSEIAAYYDVALKMIGCDDEDFLRKSGVFGCVLRENADQLKINLGNFKKEVEKAVNIAKPLMVEDIKDMSIKYGLNELLNCSAVISMYKGNFNQAFHFFDLNYKLNQDKTSKVYLDRVEDFNEFIFKYNLAVDLIKLESYGDAVKILEEYYSKKWRTEKGDLLLTLLYYNRKDYIKSRRVLNSLNESCKSSMLYYEIYNEVNRANKLKFKLLAGIAAVVLVATTAFYEYQNYFGKPQNNSATPDKVAVKNETINLPQKTKDNEKKNIEPAVRVSTSVNYKETLDKLDGYLSANDLNSFEKENSNIKYGELNDRDKKKYNDLLKRYKVAVQLYYYDKGREYYKGKNYDKSVQCFNFAYNYKNGEYLDEHVVFMLAQSLQNKNDIKAIDYYKEYLKSYKNGSYTEEVLYNMSMFYYSMNKTDEAKTYAKILSDNYKNSMYNNQKIKSILQS